MKIGNKWIRWILAVACAMIVAASDAAPSADDAQATLQQTNSEPNPGNPKQRTDQKADACINQLRQMDGAINQWALENGKANGSLPTMADIKPYLKLDANGDIPPCPAGGTYTFYPVGTQPQVTCSIPGHALPQ